MKRQNYSTKPWGWSGIDTKISKLGKFSKNCPKIFKDNISIESLQHLENFQVNFYKFSKSKISKQRKAQFAYRIFKNREKFFSGKIPRFARDFHGLCIESLEGGAQFFFALRARKIAPELYLPIYHGVSTLSF